MTRLTHTNAMHRTRAGVEGFLEAEGISIEDVAGDFTATNVEDALAELFAALGSGGAPTDADYLVGTAHAGLSAEIVVGATPGGELGGTWASPTVDATHSGSTHAATQAAAEATAAAALSGHTGDTSDAHDASAISIADVAGDFTATDVEAALAELFNAFDGHDHSGVYEPAGTVATHAGAADPHTGYLKESDFDDVDFLVGTATGFTAAEIVVGTSPGGELGGTWAAPTVDATHSGSTHAGVQAAAEATAASALSGHTGDTSDAHDASAISIVDTGGYFTGTDVEAALQELGAASAAAHIADATDAHDASAISVLDTGGFFTATDVEGVLAEIGTASASAHIADTTDAHDASAISIVDVGTYFTGTDVEAALQEVAADAAQAQADASTHIADGTDAHDASAISISDSGGYFTGTDVENALQELGDVMLAREAANVLLADNEELKVLRTNATDWAVSSGIPADSVMRYRRLASGNMEWGAGGASARDVVLERGGAGQLKLTGFLQGERTGTTFVGKRVADTGPRIRIADETILFSDGTVAAASEDTNLYRSAANVLKTDDSLVVAGSRIEVPGLFRVGGNAFPGSPSDGDLFYRDDLGQWYEYDSTLGVWLSCLEYYAELPVFITTTVPLTATATARWGIAHPGIHRTKSIYLVTFAASFIVASGGTALGASHKWVGSLIIQPSGTSLGTIDIASGASNTWRSSLSTASVAGVIASTEKQFLITWTKTGTPGNLTPHCTIAYRMVG